MKKLIPAAIDGKSILTDWIDTMFDNGRTITNTADTCTVGFINDINTQCCKWGDNELMWFCGSNDNAKDIAEDIAERLRQLEMDEHTAMSLSVSGTTITQKFFFLED